MGPGAKVDPLPIRMFSKFLMVSWNLWVYLQYKELLETRERLNVIEIKLGIPEMKRYRFGLECRSQRPDADDGESLGKTTHT